MIDFKAKCDQQERQSHWQAAGIAFDAAVVAPPRKGLDPEFVKTLIELVADKIVYVSCNPATCARDCQLIAQAGYELQWVQPVDLFPQTAHVPPMGQLSQSKEFTTKRYGNSEPPSAWLC